MAIAFLATALAVLAQNSLRIATQGGDVVLTWPSQPGETFSVGHRANLDRVTPWRFLAANQPTVAGSETTFTHSGVLTNSNRSFYFVEPTPAASTTQISEGWPGIGAIAANQRWHPTTNDWPPK